MSTIQLVSGQARQGKAASPFHVPLWKWPALPACLIPMADFPQQPKRKGAILSGELREVSLCTTALSGGSYNTGDVLQLVPTHVLWDGEP